MNFLVDLLVKLNTSDSEPEPTTDRDPLATDKVEPVKAPPSDGWDEVKLLVKALDEERKKNRELEQVVALLRKLKDK